MDKLNQFRVEAPETQEIRTSLAVEIQAVEISMKHLSTEINTQKDLLARIDAQGQEKLSKINWSASIPDQEKERQNDVVMKKLSFVPFPHDSLPWVTNQN